MRTGIPSTLNNVAGKVDIGKPGSFIVNIEQLEPDRVAVPSARGILGSIFQARPVPTYLVKSRPPAPFLRLNSAAFHNFIQHSTLASS